MNSEIHLVWKELLADISTSVALWQFAIIGLSCGLAWAINGALRAYVMQNAPENWKLGIGGIKRVLFPLSTLIFIQLGKMVLTHWQHTSMLHLASTLLLAMAVIRLAVYAMRYIIAPGGLLKTLENSISGLIWIVLALHLSGLLPQLFQILEDVKFKVGKHPVDLLLILQAILTIVVTIFIALWFSRVIENKVMRAEHVNVNVRVVLTKLLRMFLLFVAVMIALSAVGLDLTLLSVFGGALGVGLGFGLQRIASNYISGFIILLDKSMQIGDIVTVDKHYGVVNDLRSRYMILAKSDGTHAIIPNEALIINTVINHSLLEHKGRVQINLTISHNNNLELAIKLMQDEAMQQDRVLMKPAPEVLVRGLTEHGVDLALGVWVMNPEVGNAALQSSLYLAVWKVLDTNGITFAKAEVKLLEI
ncbi:MAG: mechanosensitive ion channel [Methylotenera sp.]|nr:mechanosensitive ion channel [Methylotenera sp.]